MMKKNLLLILLLLLPWLSLYAQTSFKRNYGSAVAPSFQAIGEVVALTDGHLFFAGENTRNANNRNWVIFKTDDTGEELWSKSYGTARLNYLVKVLATSDGGALLIGYSQDFRSDPNPRSLILKVNADGDQQWFNDFGAGELLGGDILTSGQLAVTQKAGDEVRALLIDDQGSLLQSIDVFSGENLTQGGLTMDINGGFLLYCGNFLFKYDEDFQQEWFRNYDIGGVPMTIYDVIEYSSPFNLGAYILAGGNFLERGLTIIDGDGVIISEAVLNTQFSNNAQMITLSSDELMIVDGGNELILVDSDILFELATVPLDEGQLEGDFIDAYDGVLVNGTLYLGGSIRNVDGGFNPVIAAWSQNVFEFQKMLGEVLPGDLQNIWGLTATTDGGYAFVGEFSYSGSSGDFTVFKTDASGNVEWQMNTGDEDVEVLFSIIQTSDGGFLTTGSDLNDTNEAITQTVVTKMNNVGVLEWQKKLPNNSLTLFNDTHGVELSDGSFAVAYPITSSNYQVTKLSATGDSLWNNQYQEEALRRVRRMQ
ncbi:MAG: hypothetical protein AAF985_17070, partial [Bacteroidota bacterium]